MYPLLPLTNHWQLLTDSELEQVRHAALRILETHGFRIVHPEVLSRLEQRGFRIDHTHQSVLPTRAQLEQVEADARKHAYKAPPEPLLRRALPGGESVGHNMTLYYDWNEGVRRRATLEDIRRVASAWHMIPEIGYTGPCMTAQDVPPPIEPLVSTVEVMRVTSKIYNCPEMILAAQLPYIEELEAIMKDKPVKYYGNGCSMTRFTIDDRAADCLVAVAKNGLRYWWVNSTPIMGANAPVTLAGALVYGVAETIGGWLAGWAMNPETELNAIPLAGMLDMRTGRILFSTPETVLVDCALYQFFQRFYDMRVGLCSGYTDAKIPGAQAVNDKLLKSLAYGWFIDMVGGQAGTLEAGGVYCPTQQIIDLELNRQTAQLARGIEISDESLAVQELLEVLASPTASFLDSDHTLQHWRSALWNPRLMDRSGYATDAAERAKTNQIVEKAEARFQDALAKYNYTPDETKIRAAEAVLEHARNHLLS